MNIAVLIKQVPASNDVSVDPVTHCLIRENVEMTVNPSDLNAVTAAIRLKEAADGKVTVFTMGPGTAKKALQTTLAMGADEAWLITDRCFGGGDTLCTARVLAAAIRHTGTYDLVLAGDVSSDGATGQVGAMVAELLGLPCASDARRIDLEGDKLTVLRNWKSQKVRVRIALPCMVTVGLGSNTPILPTLRSQMKANRVEIPELTNAELGLDPATIGKQGTKSIVTDTYARESEQSAAVMLSSDAAEAAKEIKSLLEGLRDE